jgi:hypothetical protein
VTFGEMEAALRARLMAFPPSARTELIHVLRLPALIAPTRSEPSGHPATRTFGELLIDVES